MENQDKSTDKTFFCKEGVEMRCSGGLRERFNVLFAEKKIYQQVMADDLHIDKAYVSRICNGKELPPLHIRLKIAQYLGVDSSVIWRLEDFE